MDVSAYRSFLRDNLQSVSHFHIYFCFGIKGLIENSKVIYFNTFQACFSFYYFGVLYWRGSIYLICSDKLQEIREKSIPSLADFPLSLSLCRESALRFDKVGPEETVRSGL